MKAFARFLWNLPGEFLIFLVRIYQWTLSPLIGRQCRFRATYNPLLDQLDQLLLRHLPFGEELNDLLAHFAARCDKALSAGIRIQCGARDWQT